MESKNNKNSFEYLTEQSKVSFQAYITGLLEAHSDIVHKIAIAKGNKKSGIWIDMSEAEILSGHILECVGNLMGSYTSIVHTNKLLNINYKAAQALLNNNPDLGTSINQFLAGEIDKDKINQRFDHFLRKPGIAA